MQAPNCVILPDPDLYQKHLIDKVTKNIFEFLTFDTYTYDPKLLYEKIARINKKFHPENVLAQLLFVFVCNFNYSSTVRHWFEKVISFIEFAPIILNFRDQLGNSILHYLVIRENIDEYKSNLVETILMKSPESIFIVNSQGFTPLHCLLSCNDPDISCLKVILAICPTAIM